MFAVLRRYTSWLRCAGNDCIQRQRAASMQLGFCGFRIILNELPSFFVLRCSFSRSLRLDTVSIDSEQVYLACVPYAQQSPSPPYPQPFFCLGTGLRVATKKKYSAAEQIPTGCFLVVAGRTISRAQKKIFRLILSRHQRFSIRRCAQSLLRLESKHYVACFFLCISSVQSYEGRRGNRNTLIIDTFGTKQKKPMLNVYV